MSTKKIYLKGMRFGTLTVLEESPIRNIHGHIMYEVVCDCGKKKMVLGSSLRNGTSRSCNSCPLLLGTHGMYNTREYRIWCSMKSRCSNKNDPNYKRYGGRGIVVCDDWVNSFENFYRDMGDSINLTIDRIDVNGNYCKDNCRWVDMKVQSRNKTNNNIFMYNGVNTCASEICEKINMSTSTFYNRLKRGWSIDDTINKPIRIKKIKQ